MKQARWWRVGTRCAAVGLVCLFGGLAQEAQAKKAKNEKAPATTPLAATSAQGPAQPGAAQGQDENVVYTFEDDAKMREFAELWRKRQRIILRMTVLQSYWKEDQATMVELNKKFSDDYKLDVTKNYLLDDKRRVLIEQASATPPPTPAPAQATQ